MVDIDDRFARRLFAWSWSRNPESFPFPSLPIPKHPFNLLELEGMNEGGLERAQVAWVRALELWHEEDDAFEFLTRKHAMLEDQRPLLIAIKSHDGLQSVESIIGRLRYGSAA